MTVTTMPTRMPARKWGDEPAEVAVPPIILVSSRDNAAVPYVPGPARLARAAEANGWAARQTYALAQVPERRFLNGNVARAAHTHESIAVRLRRAPTGESGWAVWVSEDGHKWTFDGAMIGRQRCLLRALVARIAAPLDAPGAVVA